MSSKRERYERANLRGGLGVRKRLSEETERTTYRLHGVQTGSAVARCHDRYGRWELGYTLGVIVRRTASVVQIRWLGDEDITRYSQGDARYEVDRGRWRILGVLRGSPLDPDNPLVVALTGLAIDARIQASSHDDTPPTEENDEMARQQSNAAAEREAAQRAVKNGDLKERETYTAKQVATRCGTDPKTMRKFFRSNHSTVEPVGQGGRYDFDAKDLPKIKREFNTWRKRNEARSTTPKPTPKPIEKVVEEMATAIQEAVDEGDDALMLPDDENLEPTPEELADIDELDMEEVEDE